MIEMDFLQAAAASQDDLVAGDGVLLDLRLVIQCTNLDRGDSHVTLVFTDAGFERGFIPG